MVSLSGHAAKVWSPSWTLEFSGLPRSSDFCRPLPERSQLERLGGRPSSPGGSIAAAALAGSLERIRGCRRPA